MKITDMSLTPLFCAFKEPYHWAQGVNEGADIVLVEIATDAGITGIGESVASPTTAPVLSILAQAVPELAGRSVYDGQRAIRDIYARGFNARGTGSAPRYFAQAVAGVELALWDAVGKAAGEPLHRILGGAVQDSIGYFGFVQGDRPDELARHAARLVAEGFEVIYLKVGRGDALDRKIVAAVREAIGTARLRLDANEVWDLLTARRMLAALAPYAIEFIEQPLPAAGGPASLAALRTSVGIPVAADQSAFAPEDVYQLVKAEACDVIVLGLHETGGIARFRKAAAIAEAAGVSICLHGVFETGITTCASNQVAATIPNLDDGNQIMWQLLVEDIVESPDLTPVGGRLPVLGGPGLGFTLDRDAVARAAEAHRRRYGG